MLNIFNFVFLTFFFSLINSEEILEGIKFVNENNSYYFSMKDINIKPEEEKIEQNYLKNSEIFINEGENHIEQLGEIESNFTLIYEVIPFYGKIKVSIKNNTDSHEINGYKSYFYIYENEKEKKGNYSNQLFVECKEGLKADNNNICIAKIRIFTQNSILESKDFDFPLYRYIPSNISNNYFFKKSTNTIPLCLNIIIYSGNISFEYNNIENIKIDNNSNNMNDKILSLSFSSDFKLTIFGIENSFYSIIPINDQTFIIGANYLLNISKESNNHNFKLLDYFQYYEQEETFYYLGFYPLNNDTNIRIDLVNNLDSTREKIFNKRENKFSQKTISSKDDYSLNIAIDKNNDINNKKENEFCFASIYQLDNITGISLINKFSQNFLFKNKYNKFPFSFPHTQKGIWYYHIIKFVWRRR